MTDDPAQLKELLWTYGEHRWKCEVSTAIREQRKIGACDCGWQVVANALSNERREGVR